jgi:hypothetical protein
LVLTGPFDESFRLCEDGLPDEAISSIMQIASQSLAMTVCKTYLTSQPDAKKSANNNSEFYALFRHGDFSVCIAAGKRTERKQNANVSRKDSPHAAIRNAHHSFFYCLRSELFNQSVSLQKTR